MRSPGGSGDAGVALDGVQGQVEAAGAFQQSDAPSEEIVDLVPALADRLLVDPAGAGRVDRGPARGMGPYFGQDLVAQIPPQVPSVADLHRVGQGPADRLGIGSRAVPADGLDAGVLEQPGFQTSGLAAGQHVDALACFGVDDDRGVPVPAA